MLPSGTKFEITYLSLKYYAGFPIFYLVDETVTLDAKGFDPNVLSISLHNKTKIVLQIYTLINKKQGSQKERVVSIPPMRWVAPPSSGAMMPINATVTYAYNRGQCPEYVNELINVSVPITTQPVRIVGSLDSFLLTFFVAKKGIV